MSDVPGGYNPNTSMLPNAAGNIVAMSGGSYNQIPNGFNPNSSVLPPAGGNIQPYSGGSINTNKIENVTDVSGSTVNIKPSIKKQLVLFSNIYYLDDPSSIENEKDFTESQVKVLEAFGLNIDDIPFSNKKDILLSLYKYGCNTDMPLSMSSGCEPIRKIVQEVALYLFTNLVKNKSNTSNNINIKVDTPVVVGEVTLDDVVGKITSTYKELEKEINNASSIEEVNTINKKYMLVIKELGKDVNNLKEKSDIVSANKELRNFVVDKLDLINKAKNKILSNSQSESDSNSNSNNESNTSSDSGSNTDSNTNSNSESNNESNTSSDSGSNITINSNLESNNSNVNNSNITPLQLISKINRFPMLPSPPTDKPEIYPIFYIIKTPDNIPWAYMIKESKYTVSRYAINDCFKLNNRIYKIKSLDDKYNIDVKILERGNFIDMNIPIHAINNNLVNAIKIKCPVETSVETPVETPSEKSEETPIETPIETPVETPIENSEEKSEETPIETPSEKSEETPAETPAEKSEETPAETPVDPLVKNSVGTIKNLNNKTRNRYISSLSKLKNDINKSKRTNKNVAIKKIGNNINSLRKKTMKSNIFNTLNGKIASRYYGVKGGKYTHTHKKNISNKSKKSKTHKRKTLRKSTLKL